MSDDLAAIRRLKRRYVRCLDAHDWTGLAETLAAGVRVEVEGHPEGREGVVARIREVLGETRCRHRLGAGDIRLLDSERAEGTWEMTDEVVPLAAGAGSTPGWTGAGCYEEEYVREAGAWRIARMRLVRSRRTPL